MKENHHYVSQFYLRNFSCNGTSIGSFMHDANRYVGYANIKRQAYKKHLYGKSEAIENALMALEYKVSITINEIIKTLKVPSKNTDQYNELLMFILLSESRVIKEAESSNVMVDKILKLMMQMDPKFNMTSEEMDSFTIGSDVPNALIMKTAVESFPALLDLEPVLLKSNCDKQFITSDCPMTKYNYLSVSRNYFMRGYGLNSAGLQIFFPLTPKITLMLYDSEVYKLKNEVNNIILLNRSLDICALNKLTFLDSHRFIYFNSLIKETEIIRDFGNLKPTFNTDKNYSECDANDGKGGMIIGFHGNRTEDKIRMKFIEIKKKYKTCELPSHMGGLQRAESVFMANVIKQIQNIR